MLKDLSGFFSKLLRMIADLHMDAFIIHKTAGCRVLTVATLPLR